MTSNYVEILVKSSDTAKPDMDALKAKLADLGRQSAQMRATVDDQDSAAKLDAIRAKLLALDKASASPRITMTQAVRAESQVHSLDAQLKALADDSDSSSGHFSRLVQALRGGGNEAQNSSSKFGTLGNVLNNLTLGLPRGFGEMTMMQKAMAGLNVATGVGEPLVAGLTVAVGGLAGGLASAGAGLGVFGLVAKAVYSQVSTAMQGYQAAQAQLDKATTKAGRVAALKAEQQAMSGLTASQKGLVTQLNSVKGAWQGFVNAASPGVIGVMSQGLMLVPRALSLIKPLLGPVEGALNGLLDKLQGALWSQGLKSFIGLLEKNTGPAITKLGTAIGHIVVGIGGILRAFAPASQGILSGLDKITGKFAAWSSSLSAHSGFKSLQNMAKQDVPLLISALQKLGGIAKIVGSQMSSMSTFGNSKMFLQVANSVLKLVDSLLKAHPQLVYMAIYAKMGFDSLQKLNQGFSLVKTASGKISGAVTAVGNLSKGLKSTESAADDATGAWGTFGGKLSSVGSGIKTAWSAIGSGLATAFTATKSAISSAAAAISEFGIGEKIAAAATKVWTAIQAAFDVVMDANPISLIIIAIAALIAIIVLLFVKFKPVRDFFKDAFRDMINWAVDAWHGIEAAFKAVVHAVSSAISTVIDWVKSHWKLIVSIIGGPIVAIVIFITSHWNQIKEVTARLIDDVLNYFKTMPGKVLGFLGRLVSDMYNLGKNIIMGLVHGIEDMFGAVGGAVKHLAGLIPKGISSILHIFSPSKVTWEQGRNIGRGLLGGMAEMQAPVAAASRRLAIAANPGAGGGGAAGFGSAAGGAGGGQMQVTLSGGDQLTSVILQVVRKEVRIKGGNVQAVLGHG